MRTLTKLLIGLVAVLGFAVAAAGVTSHAPAGAQAGGKTIDIKDFTNNPGQLAVKVGESITVKNEDQAPHTVTAKDGSFNVDVPPGGTATLTVTKAGDHPYDCTYHPGQHQPPNTSIKAS